MIREVAQSKGHQFTYSSSVPGGYTWGSHTLYQPTLNLLQNSSYDYLILQEQSVGLARDIGGLGEYGYFRFPYADFLDHHAKVQDTCRRTLFYLTWCRDPNSSFNLYPSTIYGPDYETMQDRLTENYLDIAFSLGAEVSPVGEAWRIVLNNYPQINLYINDGSHPSQAGTYLASCVFFASIFHESPIGAWAPPSVSAADALDLQTVADQVVVGNWSTWNIDNSPTACQSAGLPSNVNHWESIGPITTFDLSKVQFTDAQNGYIKGIGPEVWKTENGGDSWTQIQLPAEGPVWPFKVNNFDVTWLSADTGWFVVGGEEIDSATLYFDFALGNVADYDSFLRVFKTINGGDSWQEISPDRVDHQISYVNSALSDRPFFTDLHVAFDHDQKGTVMCSYGYQNDTVMIAFGTDDGGMNWSQVRDTIDTVTEALWFRNAEVAYKSGFKDYSHQNSQAQQLFRTTDRGQSWNEIATLNNNCCKLPESAFAHSFSAFLDNGGDTLMMINSLFQPTVYRSTNNGSSWDSISTIHTLGSVTDLLQPTPSALFASFDEGPNRIFVSYDDGVNWELEAYFPKAINDLGQSEDYIYAVGKEGNVYRKSMNHLNSVSPEPITPTFSLFPNPNQGHFQIRNAAPNAEVVVYNTLGAEVLRETTDPSGNKQLDISNSPKGIYLVSIHGPAGVQSRKLMVGH